MRRFCSVFLFVATLCFVFGFSHSAHAELKYQEKSIEESYLDAIQGKTDIDVGVFDITSEVSTVKTDSLYNRSLGIDVEEYSTAQILSETVTDKGEVEQLIAVTVFNDVSLEEAGIGIFADKGDDKWDSSYGVRAYSRIYYTSSEKNTIKYARLNKVTGGWSISDTSIALSSRTVRYGSSGWSSGNQTAVKYPTGNTYSYTTPSSWTSTALTGTYAVGTTSEVKLTRRGSSWTLKFVNNL
ncbi:hypothetical protein M3557_14650 [Bhargavaea ginsengi]|uniref:hypothetical protein n=1 Tax=Bhargavaea ginsengi TaxID=426757 RepID=UPI00203E6EE8|nr:hypothetical protein [Bhargavaea ginsengi]MCM3089156.1 hypothetical protein [Bhargavaea ginsengi]